MGAKLDLQVIGPDNSQVDELIKSFASKDPGSERSPFEARYIRIHPQNIVAAAPLQSRAPFNPKKDQADAEFLRSVAENGVIQPVVVTLQKAGGVRAADQYDLWAGHRRHQAALLAGLEEIPASLYPAQVAGLFLDTTTLIENLQRKDLAPLEEARAVKDFMERHGIPARKAARLIGKSAGHVSILLSLLNSPPEVQTLLKEGRLGARRAYQLNRLSDAKRQLALDALHSELTATAALEVVQQSEASGIRPGSSKTARRRTEATPTQRLLNLIVAGKRKPLEQALKEAGLVKGWGRHALCVASLAFAHRISWDGAVAEYGQLPKAVQKDLGRTLELLAMQLTHAQLTNPEPTLVALKCVNAISQHLTKALSKDHP